jgi:hypothetical protein
VIPPFIQQSKEGERKAKKREVHHSNAKGFCSFKISPVHVWFGRNAWIWPDRVAAHAKVQIPFQCKGNLREDS